MVVLAKETALVIWECPICEMDNTEFLIGGQSLPDRLCCSFCGHESGLINWEAEE